MKVLVTGAAGFIGSRIVRRMLAEGHDVVGVDAWRDYYDVRQKRANLTDLRNHTRFRLEEVDLASGDLAPLIADTEVIYHQAAQPGVRRSWGEFDTYVRDNIESTQRLLATSVDATSLTRFVYASSSSVYGNAVAVPAREDAVPAPRSPYGVTKLAAEHLVSLYADNFGVPTVSLRYFTVYGPGQRPDMATHRMIRAAALDEPFPLYGDGSAIRDFTFIDDVIEANALLAAADPPPGSVYNVAGGGATSVSELLDLVGDAVGRPVPVDRRADQPGDVRETGGATDALTERIGWRPRVDIRQGVKEQVAWQLAMY
jgi:UDP-glucuronate 4-epimerase